MLRWAARPPRPCRQLHLAKRIACVAKMRSRATWQRHARATPQFSHPRTCAQALSFDEHTAPADADAAWRKDADAFQRGLVHASSLLHGLALQHLRGDWDLDNLSTHDLVAPPPPNVSFRFDACHAACCFALSVQPGQPKRARLGRATAAQCEFSESLCLGACCIGCFRAHVLGPGQPERARLAAPPPPPNESPHQAVLPSSADLLLLA